MTRDDDRRRVAVVNDLQRIAERIEENADCDGCAQLAHVVGALAGELSASIESSNQSFRAGLAPCMRCGEKATDIDFAGCEHCRAEPFDAIGP